MINYLQEQMKIYGQISYWFDRVINSSLYSGKDVPTGIKAFVGNPTNDDFLIFSVGNPSRESSVLVIEKVMRTLLKDEWSSRVSRNPELNRWGGCLSLWDKFPGTSDKVILFSVDGLREEENEFLSLVGMSFVAQVPPNKIISYIKDDMGSIKDKTQIFHKALFSRKHELHKFLKTA